MTDVTAARSVYLDNAATTRVRAEAAAAAVRVMTEEYGNPSSAHALGRRAAEVLETARGQVADALGAEPSEIVFTSGGTEADNWAILGGAEARRRAGRHILTAQTEHDAVRKSVDFLRARGYEVTSLAPDKAGRIPVEAFAAGLREDTAVASVMLVNNETGAVNPVAEYADALRHRGGAALLHTDAVQGFGKLAFDVRTLGADLVSVSGHKIHAPKGVGALYIRSGVRLPPRFLGGLQEGARRAGTEGLPSIAAFGEAARLARAELADSFTRVAALRAFAVREVLTRVADARIIGGDGSPYILSLALPGYRSEVLLTCLEEDGIAVSRSSACKKGARSHVLEAMRLPPEVADGALRVSFSHFTTEDEIAVFAQSLAGAAARLFKRK